MSLKRNNSRVQSFPSPESDTLSPPSNQFGQLFIPKLENLHHLQGSRISADHLSKILDASIIAQKMAMRLAMNAISLTTRSNSDWNFINCYLDSTVILLDACNDIKLRLESFRSCLNSIPIGLHYLEGELKPSRVVLQRVATSLDFNCLRDKNHCNKMEKVMSRLKTFGKKFSGRALTYQDASDIISPELYKALTSSWAMAVLAIQMISSATSFRPLTSPYVKPPKTEPWTMMLNELSNKIMVFPIKPIEIASMEELAGIDLAAQALLKLVSTWQKGKNSSLRQMAIKAISEELRRKKDELEKALPLLEENIEELYKQIVALRINMLGLLSKDQKEHELEMIEPSSCEETKMNINPQQYQRSVTWVKVKRKMIRKSCSLARIRPRCIRFI